MLDSFILAAKKLIGKYEMETHMQFYNSFRLVDECI